MAIIPGLPKIPFLLMGGGLGAAAWRMKKNAATGAKTATAAKPAPAKENIEALLRVEPISIEVGLGLVKFVEGGQNSPLLRRITGIRRQLAAELGYVLPPVRVTDNLSLGAREYAVDLKGERIAKYQLPQGCELAIPVGKPSGKIEGQQTHDPAFGMSALWIASERAARARGLGYTVVDAVSVMGTHLAEIARRHAFELFSRQDAKKLLDRVTAENAKVVEDLVPKLLPLATVQRVLQNLLRERVSIRDAVSILEALSEAAVATKNPVLLTEYVRQSIRRAVVKPYLNAAGEMPAYFFEPSVEHAIESKVEHGEHNSHLSAAPQVLREMLNRIQAKIGAPATPVVVLANSAARFFLRQVVETTMPGLFVLSHSEIPPGVKVVSQGVIG